MGVNPHWLPCLHCSTHREINDRMNSAWIQMLQMLPSFETRGWIICRSERGFLSSRLMSFHPLTWLADLLPHHCTVNPVEDSPIITSTNPGVGNTDISTQPPPRTFWGFYNTIDSSFFLSSFKAVQTGYQWQFDSLNHIDSGLQAKHIEHVENEPLSDWTLSY